MAQPTIKDVAKLAGVSISTVSRVMNKSKPVSPEAERKVLDAINKLGFKPNELARSLVMKKSNSIGILVKDIGIEYMAQMIRGAEEIGRMYHYDILLSSTYGDLELEKKAVDFLYRKQVEGVIIISENIEAEIIVKIREYNLPYILLDRYYKANDYFTITIEYKEGMEMLCDELVKLGNREILYVRSDSAYDINRFKLSGYESSMQKNNLSRYVEEAKDASEKAGYALAEEIFAKTIPYDAVVAESDMLAIGIMNYCHDKKIAVPGDLQVAGCGGTSVGNIYRPRLTTLAEPYYDIGAVAMRFLTKILQDNLKMDEMIYLPSSILSKESTKQK